MVDATSDDGDVVITSKMILAGVYAAREFPLGGDIADLVKMIFLAMELERQDNKSSASAINAERAIITLT